MEKNAAETGHLNNSIYLRRRSSVAVPTGREPQVPLNFVTSVMRNLEALGYTLSEPLARACLGMRIEELTTFYSQTVADLRAMTGQGLYRPMYPNFPMQVMEMSDSELYFNAMVHYLTNGDLVPRTKLVERMPLLDDTTLKVIALGSAAEFESLFGQMASSSSSLSDQDHLDMLWFVSTYGDGIERLLPQSVPHKENMAFLGGLLMTHTTHAQQFLDRFCRTSTDVLRLAVAMSGGDVSLAAAPRFRKFTRAERRLLLGLIEPRQNLAEDMKRWQDRWVRLGERLHPGEMKDQFPKAASAFSVVRNPKKYTVRTFNGKVELALAAGETLDAALLLTERPGEFARRLDHVLRSETKNPWGVVGQFSQAAPKVATPLLLNVASHFRSRDDGRELRVVFPKGSVAKAHALTGVLPPISAEHSVAVASACDKALIARFQGLPPLGRVYVDPKLADYNVPFGGRSASNSLRTVARGSRMLLPEGSKTARFFLYWKDGDSRTDIDLSAVQFGADFSYKGVVAYYALRNGENNDHVHSGDLTSAPNGACEFIDLTMDALVREGVRYVAMVLNSYTGQPFTTLPECFAGWMGRQHAGSGEIFDPKTVQDRIDLTAATKMAMPLIIDAVERKAIWCDLAISNAPDYNNNVHGNLSRIAMTLQSIAEMKRPTLFDLFSLHAQARGELVTDPSAAKTVFSVANDLPFRQEEITSEFLA